MKVRWAIIGAGNIASDRFAPAIKKSATSELVAVIDINLESAKRLADRFGAKRWSANPEDIRLMDDVDAVYVATWPSAHYGNISTAAEAGKHILCEKPLASTLEDCTRIIAVCERNRVRLMVGYMMRFNPVHLYLRKMIREGVIGKILVVKAEFFTSFLMRWGPGFEKGFRFDKAKAGGGMLMDLGIHVVDLIRYLTNHEIASVYSCHGALAYETQVEDTGILMLEFDDGSYGSISLSGGIPYGRNGMELYSTRGAIIAEQSIGRAPEGRLVRVLRDGSWSDTVVESADPFASELRYFEQCVEEGLDPEPGGIDGVKALAVVMGAYESMREGHRVKIRV